VEELAVVEAGFSRLAGVDEAGRGAWAGPLVAGAVLIPFPAPGLATALAEVRDSKLLPPPTREYLYEEIRNHVDTVGVGSVSAEEIDLLGLTIAGELAMVRALRDLRSQPEFLLIDAFRLPSCGLPQRPIVRGDSLCLSIAAASIVAKVVRDRQMVELDARYPEYGFARHKGYGAPEHRRALERCGPTPIHRRTYAPLRELVSRAER
jgi:ribonuclease HII